MESARCLWGLGIGGLQIPIRFGSGSMACKLISPLNRLRGVGSQVFEIMMNGRLAVAIGCRKSIRHFFFLGSSVRRGESTFVKGSGVDGRGSSGIMGHWHRQFLHTSAVCVCATAVHVQRYRQGIWTRRAGGRSFRLARPALLFFPAVTQVSICRPVHFFSASISVPRLFI